MTLLAKKSLAIQKKKLAKCAAKAKGTGKKCSLKKMSRLKKNIAGLNSTGKTKLRRGVDKGIEVGTKIANSKTGKAIVGGIKVLNKVKNADLKGAVAEGKTTLKNVKNAPKLKLKNSKK